MHPVRTAALAGYMGLLLLVSLIPESRTSVGMLLERVPSTLQNLLHIPAFGLLAWLWIEQLNAGGQTNGRNVAWTLLIVLSYALLTELIQAGVPARTASVGDFALDAAGAGLALTVHRAVKLPRPIDTIKDMPHA